LRVQKWPFCPHKKLKISYNLAKLQWQSEPFFLRHDTAYNVTSQTWKKVTIWHLVAFLKKAFNKRRRLDFLAAWTSNEVDMLLFLLHSLDVLGQWGHLCVRVGWVETQKLCKSRSVWVVLHHTQFYADAHIYTHINGLLISLRENFLGFVFTGCTVDTIPVTQPTVSKSFKAGNSYHICRAYHVALNWMTCQSLLLTMHCGRE